MRICLCLHSCPPRNKSQYCDFIGPHVGNYAKSFLSEKRFVLVEVKEEESTLEIICTVNLVTEKEL